MIENSSQTVKEISDEKQIDKTIIEGNISDTPKEEDNLKIEIDVRGLKKN